MAVKVYGPITPSAQRVLVCLIEKEVEFEVIPTDKDNGQTKVPEYLQSPPLGIVNTVEDGDYKLHESRSIMRYYAEKFKSQGADLIGKTEEEKAIVDQWFEFESQYFHPPFCNLAINTLYAPLLGGPPDPRVTEENEFDESKLVNMLNIYERRLANSKYLAGDFFSLADISHLPLIHYIVNILDKDYLIKERKNVSAWWAKISNRPSWKKVVQLH